MLTMRCCDTETCTLQYFCVGLCEMQERGFGKPLNTRGLHLASRGGWTGNNRANKVAI